MTTITRFAAASALAFAASLGAQAQTTLKFSHTGEIAYTQPKKNGSGVRDTTVADARKLLLVPSVNEIIREAAAPALETWKREQMMLAALTLPRLPDEPEVEWLKRVLVDAEETGRKAAERGTQIHDAIERGFGGALL